MRCSNLVPAPAVWNGVGVFKLEFHESIFLVTPSDDPREDVGVSGVSARMSRVSSRENCFFV